MEIWKQVGPAFDGLLVPLVARALAVFCRGVPVYYRVWLDDRGTYARVRIA